MTPLDRGWVLQAISGPIPHQLDGVSVRATVPGSVHTDLLSAGLIPDPYVDGNESILGWIGNTDWQYSTQFDWFLDANEHVDLVFGGLDTVAEVSLNGSVVGSSRNMHRSYRLDASQALVNGENELVVRFSAPVPYADAASLSLGYRPHTNHHPYNAIRKMACSFGWDWGIDTSTSGIWKPVAIERYSIARIDSVRPIATINPDGSGGKVELHYSVARHNDVPVVLSASIEGVGDSVVLEAGETAGVLTIDVPEIERWWPRGYGSQRLYDVETTLSRSGSGGEGDLLDTVQKRVGFRSVRLDMTPDRAGTPFTIHVNEQPIYVKGANWIPDDAFPHRVTRERYAQRLEQAEFAGLNLIRVWGGGIYESEDFYDECDERGFLTWQDFLLACAAYAEEEPLYSEFEAEAREAVARIGTHASVALFNGNNENVWGYTAWNWPLRLEGKSWGEKYYYELFPAIVAELAPHVGYTPGSPFSPNNPEDPNNPLNGTTHIWDVWNQKDYSHYRDNAPRFVAEFGWQGPPTWATLTEAITDNPLTPESPGMLVHQKANDGNNKLTDGLVPHFSLPNDMGDWHWAMSLNQAIAVRTATEYFRSLAPHCGGSIVWQLNDCWPVTSWAAVDGYGRAKPLLHALRLANTERLVTIQPDGKALRVAMVNDTDSEWSSTVSMMRYSFDGEIHAAEELDVTVPPRDTLNIAVPEVVSAVQQSRAELIRAQVDGSVADWFFADYRDSDLEASALEFDWEKTDSGYVLTAHASTLVRDLTVLVDRVDPNASVDRALVSLLPGESARFTITTGESVSREDICSRLVVRSANDLVQRLA